MACQVADRRRGDRPMSWRSLLLVLLAVGVCAALALGSSNPAGGLALVAIAAGFVLWLWLPSGTAWRDAILADSSSEPASSILLAGGWFLAGFCLLGLALVLLET